MFENIDKDALKADAQAWCNEMEREKIRRFAMIDAQDRAYLERRRAFRESIYSHESDMHEDK